MLQIEPFTIEPVEAGQTIAAVLRRRAGDIPWSQVKKLIASRWVWVSGSPCLDPARRVAEGEAVVVERPQVAPSEHGAVAIRHLDRDIVVVEKPAGMPTVRRPEELSYSQRRKEIVPTLDEVLPKVIARQEGKKKGKALPPVRVVHRIDRMTSGLLVFARTVRAEQRLGLQFRAHTVKRRYLAIVPGRVAEQSISSRLVRDRGDSRRGSTSLPTGGKLSVTHVRPIEDLGAYQMIECRLETGRNHQIRIHLAELGHPLCGETVYNQPLHGQPIEDVSGAPRLALHAAELGFEHPETGEELFFTMNPPPDLQAFLSRLRQPSIG